MAKKKEEVKLNYREELQKLKSGGPKRLYFLWGTEDYLREQFLSELKALCLPEGEDSFSYKRLDGPALDMQELREAVDAIPFLSERSFVELRGVDLNHLADPEGVLDVLRDIPEYCTAAFVQNVQFEPDGRLKSVKGLREIAHELHFTPQSPGALETWVRRRFAAAGKPIGQEAAQRLIFISGDLMNRLIPEIEKVAAYAKGESVTVEDVEAVANHIPEAVIFTMTDHIAHREYDAALSVLSELLADKANTPIAMLAMLGQQMRRLYAARLASDKRLGVNYVMEVCAIRYDNLASRLMASARAFSPERLKRAVELCAEADYQMKSSSADDTELFKEVVTRIIAGETCA